MEDIINRIFDKLENADISPSSNYSMPEYYMHCAMRGREREKRTLFNWLSMSLGIDMDLINKVFDKRYNNVQNESKNMKRTIKLRENELRRMISESVKRVLNEVAELDNGAPYYLYINYDCIGEYENFDEAKSEAISYHKRYPNAIIDINDNTDENSVFGLGS